MRQIGGSTCPASQSRYRHKTQPPYLVFRTSIMVEFDTKPPGSQGTIAMDQKSLIAPGEMK